MSGNNDAKLSSKITAMRFMQRKIAEDAEKKKLEFTQDDIEMGCSDGERKTSVVVADGYGDPVIKHCPGRRSFGKYNECVQEYAQAQIKEFKKFMKQAEGHTRQHWTGGGGAPPQQGQVQEGMDVSDKDMAAALGKREIGSGTVVEEKGAKKPKKK